MFITNGLRFIESNLEKEPKQLEHAVRCFDLFHSESRNYVGCIGFIRIGMLIFFTIMTLQFAGRHKRVVTINKISLLELAVIC